MRFRGFGLILALVAISAPVCLAVPIMPGTYVLDNHPDGNAAPPLYGLRLDNLNGRDTGVYTFSFDPNDGANVELVYDDVAQEIRIRGLVFGGEVQNNAYVNPQFYQVDFTYDAGLSTSCGDSGTLDDICVNSPNGSGNIGNNRGTITEQGTDINNLQDGLEYQLADYTSGSHTPLTFQFGDDNGMHRGHDGISGWGWLAVKWPNGRWKHRGAVDWLFTATKVPDNPNPDIPEPGTMILLGSALAGLWYHRRKRQG